MAVTWSVSPAVGTISSGGLYSAPATVSSATSVTITATSAADSTKSATAVISLAPPPLTITTSTLPGGTTGAVYSAQVAAAGGTPPYVWSIGSGSWPAGLGVGASSGIISGTPSTAGLYNGAFQVKDSVGQQISKTFSLVIATALTITTASLPNAVAGTAYSATLSAYGGTAPYAWAVVSGSLPPGIALAGGGTLAGTPSTPGSYTFNVQVQDAAGSQATQSYGMSVAAPAVSVSPGAVTLGVGQTQQFSATVAGSLSTAVSWSVSPAVGTISSDGLYSAPATLGSPQTVTITATSGLSRAPSMGTASVTVVPPVQVTVSPSTANLAPSGTQQFTAAVTGTTNTAVTWSVNGATGGNSTVGTVSNTGLYVGPASVSSPLSVTVAATSVQDPTQSATANVTVTPPATVTVSPGTVSLGTGQTQQFSATVAGSLNPSVSWSLSPAVGTISRGGLYTAPATLGSPQTITVTATSAADTSKMATASMTVVPPVRVTVSPSTASLAPSGTQQLTAAVTGTTNTAVTWSVNGATGGNSTVGTVSNTGLYVGPASVSSPLSVTVTATSVQDPTQSATANVTVTPPVTVTVSPGTVSLGVGQTQQFSATVAGSLNPSVSWSLSPAVGTISSGGLYTAPATLGSPQTITVTATSTADATNKATATVTIAPPVTVSLTPTAATMLPAQAQTFTPTVGGTTNTGVTWSIAPATGVISSDGLYTAPSTISATSSVTVAATSVADATKSASAAIALIPPVQITTSSLPAGTAGTAYNATVSATGGVTPYAWSVPSNQLPPGTSLGTSTGAISGTPTTAGPYNNITMKVTDAAGYQATAALAIVIAAAACTGCPGLGVTTTTLPPGTVGSAYSATLAGIGGTSPYTWSISAGQLPPGLTLGSATGAISGNPSSTGSYNFTAMVTDSSSTQKTASQPLVINVTTAPATDAYGGLMTLKSPGGITGKWGVEKYPTADGNGRWLFTTPDGHGLWCASQFGLGEPSNSTEKYGSRLSGEKAALDRYTNWGFNCIGEYGDVGMLADMNASLLNERLPYSNGDHFVVDAVGRRTMINGQYLPTDAVKNLAYTTGRGSFTADGFDPNLAPYVAGFAAARVAPGNVQWDIYAQVDVNAYNMAMSIDDSDYTQGFGPGPDDCATPDGSYHSHVGWMALASPMNLYAYWQSNLYDPSSWIFNDPEVHAKANIVAFLSAKYGGNISALNAAWGSSYTAFNTAATRYTGEVVGTTNNTVTTLTHTLAHPGVSPGSLVIKVDGTPLITDPPRGSGVIEGRWPDGTTNIGGSINYSNGSLVVSATSPYQFSQTSPGTTSWGTVSLGKTNIVPGSVVMRLEPPDCRLDTTDIASDAYNCLQNGGPYTITGTLNYSTGVITSLSISPAIPSNEQVQFQFQWSEALPGAHTVTVDYDVNGWGVGTTLADEDGSHTGWLGGTDGMLPKPGNAAGMTPTASMGAWTDLSAWLYNYSEAFFTNTIDAIRPYFPGKLIIAQFSGLGGHMGCPRKQMVVSAVNHSDFLPFSQVTQPLLDMLVTWGLGDKPIMDGWEGFTAQADSPFSARNPQPVSSSNFATQALRGAAMAAKINSALTGRGSGGTSYQMLGTKFWAYSDTTSENANYGLVSPLDNAYDGVEATSGTHACSIPLQSYNCGGEAANYGDAVTAVRNALATWMNLVQ